ncbi:MAG: hypothetical protein ACKPKO_09690, partial [Candidatus Fonsibacter sp.]
PVYRPVYRPVYKPVYNPIYTPVYKPIHEFTGHAHNGHNARMDPPPYTHAERVIAWHATT